MTRCPNFPLPQNRALRALILLRFFRAIWPYSVYFWRRATRDAPGHFKRTADGGGHRPAFRSASSSNRMRSSQAHSVSLSGRYSARQRAMPIRAASLTIAALRRSWSLLSLWLPAIRGVPAYCGGRSRSVTSNHSNRDRPFPATSCVVPTSAAGGFACGDGPFG